MACSEVGTLRDETLDGLIKFNRELKVSYSRIKHNEVAFNKSRTLRVKEGTKEIKRVHFNEAHFDSRVEYHQEVCLKLIQKTGMMNKSVALLPQPVQKRVHFNAEDSVDFVR